MVRNVSLTTENVMATRTVPMEVMRQAQFVKVSHYRKLDNNNKKKKNGSMKFITILNH